MTKQFILEVDEELTRQAAVVLGTTNLRDTVLGCLEEVVTLKRSYEMFDMALEPGRYDFDDLEENWPGWEVDPAEEAKKSLSHSAD